ncbi:helix-turn-helix transcriptional regulator [Sporolactobacillus shoreicorticis]|uniref:Helix-turn-helix transcriptional regulator n=1 Tax=Sporolactobacillus shoreicorticis TaxID=1923877 RepID=A0ABW5S2P3_9BACL|nr:helix-turn-helix transcriptional regulator [Sporolactobacillus shoreicorticis]MCO7126504.1 helix-turn-helix transcriptional regulator [Sporolactobacillus shoreicorticis]
MKSKTHTRINIEFDANYIQKKTEILLGYSAVRLFDDYLGVYHLEANVYQEIKSVLLSLVDESMSKKPDYLEMAVCKLIEFMITVKRNLSSQSNKSNAFSPQKIVEDAVKIINSEVQNKITLKSISEKLFINKAYLSRLFKKYKQTSVQRYINLQKSRIAKELLVTTEWSVEKIAGSVGYKNSSYFSTVFKDETGMSPLKYRLYVKVTDQLENDYQNRTLKSKKLIREEIDKDMKQH